MLIYVKCLIFDYQGKPDTLFNIKSSDTLLIFKQKIMKYFNVNENIDIIDDSTEKILDSYDMPISDCFEKSSFYSVSFG